jgi:hypothetical protein
MVASESGKAPDKLLLFSFLVATRKRNKSELLYTEYIKKDAASRRTME